MEAAQKLMAAAGFPPLVQQFNEFSSLIFNILITFSSKSL